MYYFSYFWWSSRLGNEGRREDNETLDCLGAAAQNSGDPTGDEEPGSEALPANDLRPCREAGREAVLTRRDDGKMETAN